jgi:hypothetical protein
MSRARVHCIHCGFADSGRFCSECGQPLPRTCACGAAVSPGARFCFSCGAELADAAPTPAAGGGVALGVGDVGINRGRIEVRHEVRHGVSGGEVAHIVERAMAGHHESLRRHEASQPPRPTLSLHDAAERGDVEQVRAHLHWGCDLNAGDAEGETPLHRVLVEDPEISRAWTSRILGGILGRDPEEEPPGYARLAAAHAEILSMLLERGAKLDVRDAHGHTPLFVAVANKHPDAATRLLERGANPNLAAGNGSTPLLSAVTCGAFELVELLVEHGADVNARTADGSTALAVAKELGWAPSAALLAGHGATDAPPPPTMGIRQAAGEGNLQAVVSWLHHGAYRIPGAPSLEQDLLFAACEGHLEVARLLLDHGADVNATDPESGCTPLIGAALEGHADVVELLLDRGASIDAVTCRGDTALCWAEARGHREVAALLRSRGARPRS